MFDQSELNDRIDKSTRIRNFLLEQEAKRIVDKILVNLDDDTSKENFDPSKYKYGYLVYITTSNISDEYITPQLIITTSLESPIDLRDVLKFVVEGLEDRHFLVYDVKDHYWSSKDAVMRLSISLKQQSRFSMFTKWLLKKLNKIGVLTDIR